MAKRKPETLPYILGVPMRRLRPLRFQTWTWAPRRHLSHRHLSVNIFPMNGQLKLRVWALGEPVCLIERNVNSVEEGARWADKKLRGLLRALGVIES
jgi:hypothetical protein